MNGTAVLSDEMRLAHGWHLAYGPGIPTDAGWREQVRTVRDHVCQPDKELGLSLCLDKKAARDLLSPGALADFCRWLAAERCYVCTMDATPAGWTGPASLAHACRLLGGLGELLPEGVDGTVVIALTEARLAEAELQAIYANLIHAAVHAAEVTGRTGRRVRLALTTETPRFLEPLVDAFSDQFGACFDASRSDNLAEELTTLDHAEIPVLKMRLGDPSRADGALDWLAADKSNGLHLEVNDPQGFRRLHALLTQRGLA